MREEALRQFFLGELSAAALDQDCEGSVTTEGINSYHDIEDMVSQFEVQPEHLVRVCNAVLSGELPPGRFQQIGFCLLASDTFYWVTQNGINETISQVLHEWAAPEIFYPLDKNSAADWKLKLEGRHSVGKPAS